MSEKKRVVILLSGNGSNFQALLDKQHCYAYEIIGVISNIKDAFGLEIAKQHKVSAICLDHKIFSSRKSFDQRLIKEVDSFEPDIVVLAGYMRILSSEFVAHFDGRLLNIHPSLLPAYKGLNTYQRVLADQQEHHGCTIHFVTPELDSGAQIVQASLKVAPCDDEESLRQRVQAMEHKIYPMAVHLLASGRLMQLNSAAILDNRPLPPMGYQMKEHTMDMP